MRKSLPEISEKNNKEIENMEGVKSFPVDCRVSPYDWLKERLLKNGSITSWHLNDDSLMFADLFYPYPKYDFKIANRRLSYYMRKLVKNGFAKPSYRMGTDYGGTSLYGVNFQTIWDKKE